MALNDTDAQFRRAGSAAALGAAVLGLIGLAGWVFGVRRLWSFDPSLGTMKANTAICLVLLAAAAGMVLQRGPVSPSPADAASAPQTLTGVQALYAQDLVSRINAERAARNSPGAPVPQLQVDAGLQADAQAWSDHLAATGTVTDPNLPPCAGPGGS
ncbi:MAG: CAP domain-containing protein, partial [Solirubrobacteraceae bacterium]